MSNAGYNRLLLCLAAIVAAIVVVRVWAIRDAERETRKLQDVVQVYHNATELCDGLGRIALKSTNIADVVDCLRQLTPATATPRWADPPQPSDSPEARVYDMFDRVRALNRRVVITHLRALTGEDLGDDSMSWIAKYGKRHF